MLTFGIENPWLYVFIMKQSKVFHHSLLLLHLQLFYYYSSVTWGNRTKRNLFLVRTWCAMGNLFLLNEKMNCTKIGKFILRVQKTGFTHTNLFWNFGNCFWWVQFFESSQTLTKRLLKLSSWIFVPVLFAEYHVLLELKFFSTIAINYRWLNLLLIVQKIGILIRF